MTSPSKHVLVIGAGPAGLTAAYLLSKKGIAVTALESDPEYVGGIARTAQYKGYQFDIGGHRFFSKSREVEDFWSEILPNDMLVRERSSRIFYDGKFFSYPLKGREALVKLGAVEAALCVASYAKARLRPVRNPKNIEDWVSNQFGERLYRIFFKTYTEKVWGMSCRDISADWAAQRIKGLSLGKAIANAVLPRRRPKHRGDVVKTLLDSFRYPRRGPGMLWQACAEKVRAMGGKVELGRHVTGVSYDAQSARWTVRHVGPAGDVAETVGTDVVSSAPLREIAASLAPSLSDRALRAAAALKYRDFLTVTLILKDKKIFNDNWIYIHDPSVRVGRIQNFKSWSPEMVPDGAMCCYGLEYFCFEGDGLWTAKDEDLVALGRRELGAIGLAAEGDVVDGCVVRQKKAYPVYDDDYAENVDVVRAEVEVRFPSLHPVGRNGMHKYNNQDHSMMTAMLTVENIVAGRRVFDVWKVNQDAEYQEVGEAGAQSVTGLREVPRRVRSPSA